MSGGRRTVVSGVAPFVDDIRAGAMAVFVRFAEELGEPGIDGGTLWLIFNTLASRMNPDDLHETAAFVGPAEALIRRAIDGGWIEVERNGVRASCKAQELSGRISAISQRNNVAWREAITHGDSAEQLDGTLALLLGQLARQPQNT